MLILVVDDEVKVRSVICQYLKNAGFQTIEATNGVSALEVVNKYDVDLVVLDIILPKLDGFDVCKEIKKINNSIPVILLSAKTSENDKLSGFEFGCDDYVVKPFSPKELVARVNAILRRNISKNLTYRGIELDVEGRVLIVDGENIQTSKKEFDLLKFFVINAGKVVSRSEIIKNVWGYEMTSVDRTIDTHVKVLRSKMGQYSGYLATVRGIGYKLNE